MPGTKQDYINYRILKSMEIFEDAQLLADNKRWNSCVNRLYYSSFYLISALLFLNDFKAETHNGVKSQFNLHFIKTGILEINLASYIQICLTGDKKQIMPILLILTARPSFL
jgi:uncharacterized protein